MSELTSKLLLETLPSTDEGSHEAVSQASWAPWLIPSSPCYFALRLLAIIRLRLAHLLDKPGTNHDHSIVVKVDDDMYLSKARAYTRYHVIIAFIYEGRACTIMCKIEGRSLLSTWSSLSDAECGRVIFQLREFRSEIGYLRAMLGTCDRS